MRWQRRFDVSEKREVLEFVLTEGEAEDLSYMANIRLPRKPRPRKGLAAVIGKWPGETDEQIQEALDALS